MLPEALLNFVVRLGWCHGNDEVISREQMIEWFDFDHVGSTSGVWNPEKLLWLNQHYLKTLPPADMRRAAACRSSRSAGLRPTDDARLQRGRRRLPRARQDAGRDGRRWPLLLLVTGVTLDEKAAAKHLDARTRKALLGQVRERLAALPDGAPRRWTR